MLPLVSLRHHVAPAVVGALCGVRAETAEKTVHAGVCVLPAVGPATRGEAEKTGKKGAPRWTPDPVERALIDSCEAPGRRPSLPARPKRVSSGKKKRPTLKTPVVTEATGAMLASEPGPRGPPADQPRYDQSPVEEHDPQAAQQGDLADQGIAGVPVPPQKPKGGQ